MKKLLFSLFTALTLLSVASSVSAHGWRGGYGGGGGGSNNSLPSSNQNPITPTVAFTRVLNQSTERNRVEAYAVGFNRHQQ